MIRRLSVAVDDEAVFADLTGRRNPVGMRSSKPAYHLFRETYFDTSDGALQRAGLTLCIHSEARGPQIVKLALAEDVTLDGVVRETTLTTPVVDGGLYATLEVPSEISARVTEVAEPDALRPTAALDIDREERELKPGFFGRATHRIAFDEVIAHAPGATRVFQSVTITEMSRASVKLETLGERLRAEHDVDGQGFGTYERVRSTLIAPKGAPKAETPQDVRVSLLLLRDWEVALVEGPKGMTLPGARGSGEELAREYLTELGGGGADAELDLVGFATARRGGSDLEVWLHEIGEGAEPTGVHWIPLTELMERMGGPRLRDPGLIATMLMLVRSEIGYRLLRDAPARRGPPRRLPAIDRADVKAGKDTDDYLSLDLSIIDFNTRVLELAEDPDVPLLERIRFLSIFSSNNDEFFVVRVGRMKDEVARGNLDGDEDLSPEQLLDLVAVRIRALLARQYACLNQVLLPALAERDVRLVNWEDLTEDQKTSLRSTFHDEVFPLLTPLAMAAGPGRAFPRLVSMGLALAVVLRSDDEERAFGYVPIPENLKRFHPVPGTENLISVERLITANADRLFPGSDVEDGYAFRASRVGDVDLDEDNSGNLLDTVADEVEARPFKPVIRLEVGARMPREVRAYLLKAIRGEQPGDAATLTRSDIYEADGPVDLTGIADLCDLEVEGGVYEKHSPIAPLDGDTPIFERLAEGDVLVHHPFQDFDSSVGRFLREAAADPDVVAIKLTLYRTGMKSPIMEALLKALAADKEVAVFVELKARFDEASNIHWTHRLSEAGARVVYGVVGFKTHAKTALVIRREANGVRRYVHIGTGNYNAATARFYTDLGLMSSDPDLGADLHDFFNELTGAEQPPQKQFRRLLVAPNSLVQRITEMIKREVEHAKAGRPAKIQVKVNGLADRKVVRQLYKAAQKGVQIDLIVRSICTLRPGVEGLSPNIQVRSILGRFLEHSRIFYFENAGQGEYYIGSADLRARNLRRRVEVITPVDDTDARAVLRAILDRQLADPRAWVLRQDGVFERLEGDGETGQQFFMRSGGRAEA